MTAPAKLSPQEQEDAVLHASADRAGPGRPVVPRHGHRHLRPPHALAVVQGDGLRLLPAGVVSGSITFNIQNRNGRQNYANFRDKTDKTVTKIE